MSLTSIGDLARSLTLRQSSVQIKQQLARLTEELSTGRVQDVVHHLNGNLTRFSEIEHGARLAEAHRTVAQEALSDMSVMQTALDEVHGRALDLAGDTVTVSATTGPVAIGAISEQARGTLSTIVSALNTQAAGRSLFAGAQVSGPALASADVLLTEARAAISGASTTADVQTALDVFFTTPGGPFETLIYSGGTAAVSAYRLGAGESVELDIKADDTAFRDVLKQVVSVALADDASLGLSRSDQMALVKDGGTGLLAGLEQIIALQADLGISEERTDRALSRLSAEISGSEIARNDLISADAFETAGELETVQFQLETIFTLTARSSRLRLSNFL